MTIDRDAAEFRAKAVLAVIAGGEIFYGPQTRTAGVSAKIKPLEYPILRRGIQRAHHERAKKTPGVVRDIKLVLAPKCFPAVTGAGRVIGQDINRGDFCVVSDSNHVGTVERSSDDSGDAGCVFIP